MNARAIKKHLMRHHSRGRAYLRLSVPRSILPPEPSLSELPSGFRQGEWDGEWQLEGSEDYIYLRRVSCYNQPVQELGPHEFFPEQEDENCWVIWESGRQVFAGKKDAQGYPAFELHPIPESMVAQLVAWTKWRDSLYEFGLGPILDQLNDAHTHAKAMHWAPTPSGVTALYAVKWFLPERKHRFCRALSKAMRLAKKQGVALRIRKDR